MLRIGSIKKIAFCLVLTALLLNMGCSEKNDSKSEQSTLFATYGAKVRGLDPGDISDITSHVVACQMIETLYQYHYLKRPYELIPAIAESMPQASQDRLTYTIKIKKGVYFTDDECFENGIGREVIADDFIFAWKRVANIKYLSKNWWVFDNRIVGLDEFREYTKTCKKDSEVDYSRPVEGLIAKDDYTLVIKLKKPWTQIAYLLAHIPTAPVAKEAVDYYGANIINHPIGTGPYRLKTWHRGSYIELVRNEKFREAFYPSAGAADDAENGLLADAGKRLPITDRVLMVLVQEDSPRWFLFMQGKLDASGIPKDNFAEAIDTSRKLTPQMKARNIRLTTFRDPSTYWFGFNMEDKILGKNKPLRQAISCAIDRQKYIELFTNNRAEPAYGPIPPLMKAYNPQIKKIAGTEYNTERAKQLLKEAEKNHGGPIPTLTLSVPGTDVTYRQIGEFVKRCFDEAGLKIEIDYMDWPSFQEKVKTKSAQIFSLGWIADYPDEENFLQLFYSKNKSPGPNNFNYSNEKFDRIFEKISVMSDCAERTELYRQAEQIAVEDCPAVFLTHGVAFLLYHDWLSNTKPHAFAYNLSQYRRVDEQKRKAYKQLLKELK